MHVPPFTYTNTFHVSLTEEFPQRDVITSELETRINLNECFFCIIKFVKGTHATSFGGYYVFDVRPSVSQSCLGGGCQRNST